MSIKKGDLVMVVIPSKCCGSAKDIGKVFIAGGHYSGPQHCRSCGDETVEDTVWISGERAVRPVYRLKKIDPPSTGELDRVPVRMKEPA